jgi:hypothetical protein
MLGVQMETKVSKAVRQRSSSATSANNELPKKMLEAMRQSSSGLILPTLSPLNASSVISPLLRFEGRT